MGSVLVKLGNTAPIELIGADPTGVGGERKPVLIDGEPLGNTVTVYSPPDSWDLVETLIDLRRVYDAHHSDDPPEWVEVYVDGELAAGHPLGALVAANYTWGAEQRRQRQDAIYKRDADGKVAVDEETGAPIIDHREPAEPGWLDAHACAAGRPDGWVGLEDDPGDEPEPSGGAPEVADETAHNDYSQFGSLGEFILSEERWRERELRTNAGNDWQAAIMGNAAASGAGTGTSRAADYIALTANATAPAATDTTLTAEITTAGLTRAQGAYAHTTGTATYTVSKTFTSQSADGTVLVAKIGVFNALTTGTLAFTTLLAATANIQGSQADTLAITETVSI